MADVKVPQISATEKNMAASLMERFCNAGAQPVEPMVLQPAETLLDLYGEDIRARAFVTQDVTRGEMMMRPDFTVPVVQMHMSDGAEPARYTYNGPVWRQQSPGSTRLSEYIQVGFELFDRGDPAAADAEVFTLFSTILSPHNLRAATGDMGILRAAVLGLKTSERRKLALLRHLWRPQRFRALLDRFGGKTAASESRKNLIQNLENNDIAQVLRTSGAEIGLRSSSEVKERVAILQEDAKQPPISKEEVELLDDILKLKGASDEALSQLQAMAVDVPSLQGAVLTMGARLEALSKQGIGVSDLPFEASFGRTALEYYDGFVFGFIAGQGETAEVVASGGRYDALTRVLGQGRSIPAVGGVIRPGLVLAAQGAGKC